MPYREKTAWLMLGAIVVCFVPYFARAAVLENAQGGVSTVHQLWLFALTVIAQVVILVAGNVYLAIRWPEDARTPPDERDRAITARSMTIAYYVLIAGTILVGCVMPFNSSGWPIVNAALAMIVSAELVHYGAIAVGYRRQA